LPDEKSKILIDQDSPDFELLSRFTIFQVERLYFGPDLGKFMSKTQNFLALRARALYVNTNRIIYNLIR